MLFPLWMLMDNLCHSTSLGLRDMKSAAPRLREVEALSGFVGGHGRHHLLPKEDIEGTNKSEWK